MIYFSLALSLSATDLSDYLFRGSSVVSRVESKSVEEAFSHFSPETVEQPAQ